MRTFLDVTKYDKKKCNYERNKVFFVENSGNFCVKIA